MITINKNISVESIKNVFSLIPEVLEKTKIENSREFILNEVKNKRNTISGLNCLYDGIFEVNLYKLKKVISNEELQKINSKIEIITLSSGQKNSYINIYDFNRIFNL